MQFNNEWQAGRKTGTLKVWTEDTMSGVETRIPTATEQAGEVVWRPTQEYLTRSRLLGFMRRHGIEKYPEFLQRSVDDPEWFWAAVVEDIDFQFYEPFRQVLDLSRGKEWARWFTGGRLNYVHNALDKHAAGPARHRTAIRWEGEEGQTRSLTYGELDEEVRRLSNVLMSLGVSKGDRVGLFMPMGPEVAAASLAVSKIGAIYIPLFSGFNASAIATRLKDAEARLLITADGFYRRGQNVPMKETADEAVRRSPSVEHVLVYRRTGRPIAWTEGQDVWWHEALAQAGTSVPTVPLDPEDPFMIIYTSGTTGRPKGAIHSHDGFPLKGVQDMAHLFDVQEDDVLFWFTDMGWMMGPWAIIGALTLGATVLLYDGAPDYPRPDRVWELVERHRVTVLGISPTAIRALMRQGEEWVRRHDLSSLRVLGSTGEPWNPEPWLWYFEHVGGSRCPIINYSGGTEISGGILGGTTIQPLRPMAFTGPVPGMDADVVDEKGRPVRGSVGELVLRQPWPGMTRGFWRDRERYLQTYWSRWPGVWAHGDWALIDKDSFWYIQGRSDDTLKVAGKRLGPAEVETAAMTHPAVAEAAAIGKPDELKGEVPVVFAVLNPGHEPGDGLREEIIEAVARELGRPFRPNAVRFVEELPKTRNAKVMRRVVRAAYLDRDLGDITSLENPASVEAIRRSR